MCSGSFSISCKQRINMEMSERSSTDKCLVIILHIRLKCSLFMFKVWKTYSKVNI